MVTLECYTLFLTVSLVTLSHCQHKNHNGLCYFKPLSDKKNDILDVKEADPQFPPNCLMPF